MKSYDGVSAEELLEGNNMLCKGGGENQDHIKTVRLYLISQNGEWSLVRKIMV
jgi:hypothetical protein